MAVVAPLIDAVARCPSQQAAWPMLCHLDEQLASLQQLADARSSSWSHFCAKNAEVLPLIVQQSLSWPEAPAGKAVELLYLALQHVDCTSAAAPTLALDWLGLPVAEPPGMPLPQLVGRLRDTPIAKVLILRTLDASSLITRASATEVLRLLLLNVEPATQRQLFILLVSWIPDLSSYWPETQQLMLVMHELFRAPPPAKEGGSSAAAASTAGGAATGSSPSGRPATARRLSLQSRSPGTATSPASGTGAASQGTAPAAGASAAYPHPASALGHKLIQLLQPGEIELLTTDLTRALERQSAVVACHPHAPAYRVLHRLTDSDTHCLDLDDGVVLCESLRQLNYVATRIDSIKAEIKYSDKRVIARLNGWYSVSGFQLAIENPRRSKCVKTLDIYYCSQPVTDLQVRSRFAGSARPRKASLGF